MREEKIRTGWRVAAGSFCIGVGAGVLGCLAASGGVVALASDGSVGSAVVGGLALLCSIGGYKVFTKAQSFRWAALGAACFAALNFSWGYLTHGESDPASQPPRPAIEKTSCSPAVCRV